MNSAIFAAPDSTTPRRCTIRINPAAATLIGAGRTLAAMFALVLL